MATLLIPPRFQLIIDDIAAAGYLVFTYDAGTSTKKTTWKDQGKVATNTNPIVLDSQGQADIWMDGSYKVVVAVPTADDPPTGGQIVYTVDNINAYDPRDWTGLTASIADLNSTTTTSLNKTSDYNVVLTDRGKTILADATSGDLTVNLLAASSASDGFEMTIKKIDITTNKVIIDPAASETVDTMTTLTLYDFNDFVKIHCDGSNYQVIASQIRGTTRAITNTQTLDLTDEHKLILADATGGAIIVNLPSAATVARGYKISVKKTDSTGSAITLTPSGGETIDGQSSLIINIQYATSSIISDGTNWFIDTEFGVQTALAYPLGYGSGTAINQTNGNETTQIDFPPGEWRDSTNTGNIKLTSTISKDLTQNWAAGNGNGGRPTGAANNPLAQDTWYHCFLIAKTDGTVDAGFDTDVNATNLLSDATGYSLFRRVGSIKTESASTDILSFSCLELGGREREFLWKVPVRDLNTGTIGASILEQTITVPPDVKTLSYLMGRFVTATGAQQVLVIYSYDVTETSPAGPVDNITFLTKDDTGGQVRVRTNTNQQVKLQSSDANAAVGLSVAGWYDYL